MSSTNNKSKNKNDSRRFGIKITEVTRSCEVGEGLDEPGLIIELVDPSAKLLADILDTVGHGKPVYACGDGIMYVHVYPDHVTLDTDYDIDNVIDEHDVSPKVVKYDDSPEGVSNAIASVADEYRRVVGE